MVCRWIGKDFRIWGEVEEELRNIKQNVNKITISSTYGIILWIIESLKAH